VLIGVVLGVVASASDPPSAVSGAPSPTSDDVRSATTSVAAVTSTPLLTRTPTPTATKLSPVDRLPQSTPISASLFVVPVGRVDHQRLYVSNTRGSVWKKLRTPRGHNVNSPTLSADRRSVIYIDRTSDSLRTVAVDGSGDRLLIAHLAGCASITHATWNPADQSVLVVRCLGRGEESKLIATDLTGKVVREISPPHLAFDDPAFSPDGRLLAYWATNRATRGGGSIFIAAADGSTAERRLTHPGATADSDPAWSPDGSQIAFTRIVSARNSDVYRIPVKGGKVRRLVTGPTDDEKPAWSPDGKKLLVISNRTASGEPGERQSLCLVSFPGRDIDRLAIAAAYMSTPVWSRR